MAWLAGSRYRPLDRRLADLTAFASEGAWPVREGLRLAALAGDDCTAYTSSTAARRISATLQACAMQPRGV